jgi:hypothetical protein
MTNRLSHRDLLLPKEHGGWSLAFEPVALGLLVAPSGPPRIIGAEAHRALFDLRQGTRATPPLNWLLQVASPPASRHARTQIQNP